MGQLSDYLMRPLDSEQLAKRLFDYIRNGHWNIRALQQLLPALVLQAILPIHVTTNAEVPDTLIWNFNPTGEFTVASLAVVRTSQYPA